MLHVYMFSDEVSLYISIKVFLNPIGIHVGDFLFYKVINLYQDFFETPNSRME